MLEDIVYIIWNYGHQTKICQDKVLGLSHYQLIKCMSALTKTF